jgi:two-component system OmpR family sensor kinase
MNLSTKVLATLALSVAVALLTASLLIGRNVDATYRAYVTDFRRGQLRQAAAQAAQLRATGSSWAEIQSWLNSSELPGGRGRGPRWQRSTPSDDQTTRFVLVEPSSGTPLIAGESGLSAAALEAALPVVVDDAVAARVASALPLDAFGQAEQDVIDQVNRAIGLSALISGMVALLLGALLVASILRPLRRLDAGVQRVADGDLSVRVTLSGRDEIGQLARRFNDMAASLEAQEALRQRLVADIAHELRTPLSVVQGNLQAILDGVYPLSQDEIRTIHEETQLLSHLVAQLHELAQAEAGQLPLAREVLNINQVLEQMASAFRALADQHEVTLSVNQADATGCVLVDAHRLQQILHNLLANALRHTPPGGHIRLGAGHASQVEVRFWVENVGPGIEARDLPHVYDRFYRVESGQENNHAGSDGGAGLGLAIVKALVEAHGGHVGVESTPGKTTTFWFELAAVEC